MTLADLLTTLETRGALPPSRVKDLKTSIRYLAAALGHASPEQCPAAACLSPTTWAQALEDHFISLETQGRTISAVTRRNTRNNLRVLLRQAEAQGFLTEPLPPRLLRRPERHAFILQQRATSPYKAGYPGNTRRFKLHQAQWPPEIQAGWQDYLARCGMRLREVTTRQYSQQLEVYLGYLANICHRTPVWEDLFDVTQVTAFVRWHAARNQRGLTRYAVTVVISLTAMANLLQHPAHPALKALRRTLKDPPPVHIKRHHMVSLATLEAVADACLADGRAPLTQIKPSTQHPGAQRAVRFQIGLILKLLVRVPLRQRNVREMRLGQNLAKDSQTGHWQLEFRGDELKVGHRGMQVNRYHVDLSDYCPAWIPLVEEFLAVHRPKLPNAATSPFVFLTRSGRPYTSDTMREELGHTVALRTGQRFYPHLIRTMWATEYLTSTPAPDFVTAAVMLGDLVRTVMEAYFDIANKDHHVKAKAFLSTALTG